MSFDACIVTILLKFMEFIQTLNSNASKCILKSYWNFLLYSQTYYQIILTKPNLYEVKNFIKISVMINYTIS